MYQGCFGIVTWYASLFVQQRLNKVKTPLPPSAGTFTRTMGADTRNK